MTVNPNISAYQLLQTIGKGTFGKVKLARHTPTGQMVAIKILHKNRILSEADKVRVDREICILRKVRHPNIIQLLQIISTKSHLFIVTQYAQGGQLFKHIVNSTRLDEDQASRMFQQILNAVEYMHSLGIAHRDLKPQNLLLDKHGNIKVVDFGLGNIYAQSQKLTTACGSPSYAAPEMLSGQPYNGLMTDIWSCGVVLYAMCCGYLPFEDSETLELYRKIKEGNYTLPGFCSENLKCLLRRVLNVVPEMRLTIPKIREQPFCLKSAVTVVQGMVAGISCIPVQTALAQQTSYLLNCELEQLCGNVRNGKHNGQTACYYLLLQHQLHNSGKELLDYFISKESYIHRHKDVERLTCLINRGRIQSIDRDAKATTKKNVREKRHLSIQVDKTEKKLKSGQKRKRSSRKALLQRYKFA